MNHAVKPAFNHVFCINDEMYRILFHDVQVESFSRLLMERLLGQGRNLLIVISEYRYNISY